MPKVLFQGCVRCSQWRQRFCCAFVSDGRKGRRPVSCLLVVTLICIFFTAASVIALSVLNSDKLGRIGFMRQVARCTKIIDPNTDNAKYVINVKQIAKVSEMRYPGAR